MDDLTPAQHIAASALAKGKNIVTAAHLAGVTRQTVATWRDSIEAFRETVAYGLRETDDYLEAQLTNSASNAATYLDRVVADETELTSNRIRAAAILFANKLRVSIAAKEEAALREAERDLELDLDE